MELNRVSHNQPRADCRYDKERRSSACGLMRFQRVGGSIPSRRTFLLVRATLVLEARLLAHTLPTVITLNTDRSRPVSSPSFRRSKPADDRLASAAYMWLGAIAWPQPTGIGDLDDLGNQCRAGHRTCSDNFQSRSRDQLHFQQRRSAASASPRPGRLSGTRRAARPVGDLDLVRRTLRMQQLRSRHVAEGVIDLGLGLGGMNASG